MISHPRQHAGVAPVAITCRFLVLEASLGTDGVVPMSAKKLTAGDKFIEDRDGNTLYRVVLFKSSFEKFKKKAREAGFSVREFTYSEAG